MGVGGLKCSSHNEQIKLHMGLYLACAVLLFGYVHASKVAIVGAGMGGAFAADALWAKRGLSLQIDVFEATKHTGDVPCPLIWVERWGHGVV